MASRGRHGAQAREDEQRREERGDQQVPAPQGPTVLPPPPPVDYGVFVLDLVQVMQTQAQTQAALQAQLQAQVGERDGPVHGGEEGSPEEVSAISLEAGQEEGIRVPVASAYSRSSESVSSCTADTSLQAQRQEGVSSLRKDTRRHRMLEASREVPEVWQYRAPDQRLPQTLAVFADRGASPSSGRSSDTNDKEARKASGPSPSLAVESDVEAKELEVPLSVHTPAGTVAARKCIPSLPVCIEDRGLFGCFYLLKMKDYDAILGLDWLEEHYALAWIWRLWASSNDPLRLEGALNRKEGFSDPGVQSTSIQNRLGRRFGHLLGLAEEGIFD
ncbi:hypothetical protein Taro_004087 [Colocasia esculenta]|uniref:Uncharacterized protein n=1 Tax=Colocasia esculenta TaxID=4460 RepID=A0A843TP06_COLES|nr:hypothetical protein [Colocasia esculenta]